MRRPVTFIKVVLFWLCHLHVEVAKMPVTDWCHLPESRTGAVSCIPCTVFCETWLSSFFLSTLTILNVLFGFPFRKGVLWKQACRYNTSSLAYYTYIDYTLAWISVAITALDLLFSLKRAIVFKELFRWQNCVCVCFWGGFPPTLTLIS